MRLRVGFVALVRPQFRGGSAAAAAESLGRLQERLHGLGCELFVPEVASGALTAAGDPLPSFAVHDGAGAEAAARQLEGAAVDLLLIQQTTFATGDLLAPLLGAARRVGLWALPESAGSDASEGPLPLNSLCGLNMSLSLLEAPEVAHDRPVKWFYGEDDDWFGARLEVTVAALRGLKALETARVLQIGGAAPGFFGLQGQAPVPGPTVDHAPLASLLQRTAAVSEERARALAAERGRAEPSDVTPEQLVRSARIELALAELAAEGDYQALAVRCWPELPERCGSMACAAMGSLGATVPAACEGDVAGALSMLVLKAMSGAPAVLMDLSALDQRTDALMFWHCGNAPLSWAAGGRSRLTTHFNREGVGVVRDMTLKAGPVTGFRLLAGSALVFSGRFAGAATGGRAAYAGVHGWLEGARWNGAPVSGRDFVANVLDAGLPHHYALAEGELTTALQELCAWLGSEPLPARPTTHALRRPHA